ncbi:very short patch repair endonuclease [Microbacterium lacticum]
MTRSWASSEHARRTMVANRRRDTQPEMRVRRLLHAAGLRYRVDFMPVRGLRSRADIVFTRQRIAVFIDGCFWHACPTHAVAPKTNVDYWGPKLARNRARDAEVSKRLMESGWQVLRFWEHEPPEDVAGAIMKKWRASDYPSAAPLS